MYDQTKEDGLKIKGHARVMCVFVLETGKLKAEKEHQRVPICATSIVSLVVLRCVLIDTSRQKNRHGTGIKSYERSEQQIYLDLNLS